MPLINGDADVCIIDFVKIDHEIIFTVILLLLFKEGYLHKVLVNRLIKFAQDKVWLGELITT